MKIKIEKKKNDIINDYYLEISTRKNNNIVKDNFYGFSEKEAVKHFKNDFKYKLKNNEDFRNKIKIKSFKKIPNHIVLGSIFCDK